MSFVRVHAEFASLSHQLLHVPSPATTGGSSGNSTARLLCLPDLIPVCLLPCFLLSDVLFYTCVMQDQTGVTMLMADSINKQLV